MPITKHISELTFASICEYLGQDHFYMHQDATDAVRYIHSQADYERVCASLNERWGDVSVMLTYGGDCFWGDRVKIIDSEWRSAYDSYCARKMEFCNQYGCD